MALMGLIGPGMFNLTFAYFIGPRAPFHLPGAPFLVAVTILLAALPLAFYATRPRPA
jgi:DHA1 family tetracycline resistance protein-like MFS transporter